MEHLAPEEEYVLIDDPRWAPLEKFILDPLHLDDWMWIEAWVRGNRRVEVYKHYETRLTIHLDERGHLLKGKRKQEWMKNLGNRPIREIGRYSR